MFRLQFRGFVSLLVSVAFLVVVVTGLVLWLSHSPQTFGIGKGVWKHSHIFVSLLLLVACLLHWWLNWPTYWSYLRKQASSGMNLPVELALAMLVTALVAGTAALDDHGKGPMQRSGENSPKQGAKGPASAVAQPALSGEQKPK